jgi:pyruvate-formate lyase-activating enzyme
MHTNNLDNPVNPVKKEIGVSNARGHPVDLALRLARGQQAAEQSLGVIFFGGEPLLHPERVRDTIRYCRELSARTGQLFHF